MITKLYQKTTDCFVVLAGGGNLRLMPYNYQIAYHDGICWMMGPDLACPLQTVMIVSSALMVHRLKYSSVSGCELLEVLNSEKVTDYIDDCSSQVYVDELARVVTGGSHI